MDEKYMCTVLLFTCCNLSLSVTVLYKYSVSGFEFVLLFICIFVKNQVLVMVIKCSNAVLNLSLDGSETVMRDA